MIFGLRSESVSTAERSYSRMRRFLIWRVASRVAARNDGCRHGVEKIDR
jgi:hypothetical protein